MSERKNESKTLLIVLAVIVGLTLFATATGNESTDGDCSTMDFKTGVC